MSVISNKKGNNVTAKWRPGPTVVAEVFGVGDNEIKAL